MSNTEYFRAVNQYQDMTTGELHYVYTKVYDEVGKARAQATSKRGGRYANPRPIRNPHRNGSFFEFVGTWAEKVKEWERV